MIWQIVEFVLYIGLLLVLFIMMITKLNTHERQFNIKLYEKKLDLLHNKFIKCVMHRKNNYHYNQKLTAQKSSIHDKISNIAVQSNISNDGRENVANFAIGNVKTNEDVLQNFDLQDIVRLVKVNGDGFLQSNMKDIKLYSKMREMQLEEYQNIIINRRFREVKAIEFSKWKLVWQLIKLQLKRKNPLVQILFKKKIGYFHSLGSAYVLILQFLVALTVFQSIRRIFQFQWYGVSVDNLEDESTKTMIVVICAISQVCVISPVFLFIQTWIENIQSEFKEVKRKIKREIQSKNCLCQLMLDQISVNVLVTSIIFIVGVYQTICLYSEMDEDNIDYFIIVVWVILNFIDIVFLRNIYVILLMIFQYFSLSVNSVKTDIRMVSLVCFIIDLSKKRKSQTQAQIERKSILNALNHKRQKKNDDLFEDAKSENTNENPNPDDIIQNQQGNQKFKLSKQSTKLEKTNQQNVEIDKADIKKDENAEQIVHEEDNEEEEDSLSDCDLDLDQQSIEEFEKQEQGGDKGQVLGERQQTANIDKQKPDLENNSNSNNNNILPQSILNNPYRNTTSLLSNKAADSNILNENDKRCTQRVCSKFSQEIVEATLGKSPNNEKRLNTSFVFDNESIIQNEQHITLETIEELKIPKNKKNYTHSWILEQTLSSFIPTDHDDSRIKTHHTVENLEQTFNYEQELSAVYQKKQKLNLPELPVNLNDKSLTINREIQIGKIQNLEIAKIMNLKEQIKFENDTSFLKNLGELKQMKANQNLHAQETKTPNDISIFQNKDTSTFLVGDEFLQNHNQKNANESFILNKSELVEILKPYGLNSIQNA